MAKREATHQLTAENFDREDDDDDNTANMTGDFNKASGDVMSRRIIKKAKRRLGGTEAPSSNPFGRFSAFSSATPSSNAASLATSGSAGFLSKPSFGIPAFTAPASEFSNKEKDESKESTSSLFSTTAPSVSASNFPPDNEKEKADVIPTANLNDKSKVTDSKASSKDKIDAPTDSCYSAQITALNISFLNWIKMHIEGNPLVDLTPVFNDYTKHMTDIEGKYGGKQGSNSSSKTANDKEAVSKIQIAESKTKTESESISIFSAADKKDAEPAIKTPLLGFFSSAQTSTPAQTLTPATQPVITHVKEEEAKDDNDGEEDDTEKDEKKTIVEENAIYTTRCKLFFKKGNDWKEMGVGMLYLKVLNNKAQLLVRMETAAGKILLNVSLHENMPAGRVGKNNVSIISIPNPPVFLKEKDGDNTIPLNYLIRVKDKEEADELLKQINENKVK